MDKLDNIIKENINKFLINERASSNLYHYINGDNLVILLKSNEMKTCYPEQYLSDDGKFNYIDGKDRRFISFTRNRNAKEGYPVLKYSGVGDGDENYVCRLDINGDYFNTHNIKNDKNERIDVKFKPIDWCYWDYGQGGNPMKMADITDVFASNGKEYQMQSNSHDYYYPIKGDATDKYNHPMSQAEDRLTSFSAYIPKANEYINCIDIFVTYDIDKRDYKELEKIWEYANKLGIEVNFYDNLEYFNKQYVEESFGIDGIQMMIWN